MIIKLISLCKKKLFIKSSISLAYHFSEKEIDLAFFQDICDNIAKNEQISELSIIDMSLED